MKHPFLLLTHTHLARHEMLRAAADLADCALAAYDGAETVRESLKKLSAQLNTESLHFS